MTDALMSSHLLPVLHRDSPKQTPKDEKDQSWELGNAAILVTIAD